MWLLSYVQLAAHQPGIALGWRCKGANWDSQERERRGVRDDAHPILLAASPEIAQMHIQEKSLAGFVKEPPLSPTAEDLLQSFCPAGRDQPETRREPEMVLIVVYHWNSA